MKYGIFHKGHGAVLQRLPSLGCDLQSPAKDNIGNQQAVDPDDLDLGVVWVRGAVGFSKSPSVIKHSPRRVPVQPCSECLVQNPIGVHLIIKQTALFTLMASESTPTQAGLALVNPHCTWLFAGWASVFMGNSAKCSSAACVNKWVT